MAATAVEEFKLLDDGNSANSSHFTKFAFKLLLEIDAKSDIFHQFLQFERANENLEFRREVFKFKQIPVHEKSKLAKIAKSIWDEFGKEDAVRCINIPAPMRQNLEEKIHENKIEQSMYDLAVKEVDQMLVQGPFPRFGNKICDRVQESWDKITENMSPAEVGKILFMNWFMRDPEVMPMFKRDMAKHGAMMVSMIETAVGLLADLKSLVPKLARVGVRHANYGTIPTHFKSLGEALLLTLQELLDQDYNSEIEIAWKTVFEMMTSVMNAAIAHAQETRSNASGSERNTIRPYTEMDTMLEVLHLHPELLNALESYYNPEDLALRGEFYNFQKMISEGKHSDAELLGKAQSIYDTYICDAATCKVRLSPSIKVSVESRLKKATTAPEVYDLYEEAWQKLDARLEKRPLPIFKESIGSAVQNSWDAIAEKLSKDKIGKILFMNFFQIHPEAMQLFGVDMVKHGAMLAGLMDASVHSLENLKDMIRNISLLGSRHTKYGAKPEWFPDFGVALVQTFKDCLKDKFTDQCKESWEMMFLFISTVMVLSFTKHVDADYSDTESTGSGSSAGKHSNHSKSSHTSKNSILLHEVPSPVHSTRPSPSTSDASSGAMGSPSADSRAIKKKKTAKDDKCILS